MSSIHRSITVVGGVRVGAHLCEHRGAHLSACAPSSRRPKETTAAAAALARTHRLAPARRCRLGSRPRKVSLFAGGASAAGRAMLIWARAPSERLGCAANRTQQRLTSGSSACVRACVRACNIIVTPPATTEPADRPTDRATERRVERRRMRPATITFAFHGQRRQLGRCLAPSTTTQHTALTLSFRFRACDALTIGEDL